MSEKRLVAIGIAKKKGERVAIKSHIQVTYGDELLDEYIGTFTPVDGGWREEIKPIISDYSKIINNTPTR
jgi:hypothetical protein